MKTSTELLQEIIKKTPLEEKEIVKFKIGRGGMFNNSGHLSYVGAEEIKDTLLFNEELNYNEKEKGYYPLNHDPTDIVLTDEEIKSGICKVDYNGDSHTEYTQPLSICDEKELVLIAKEWNIDLKREIQPSKNLKKNIKKNSKKQTIQEKVAKNKINL